MADKRIDAHTNTTTVADVDEFIVDSGSNGTRNITYSNLKSQILGSTSIATIGNSVTEAIYNTYTDIGDLTQTGVTGATVAAQISQLNDEIGVALDNSKIATLNQRFANVNITTAWGSSLYISDLLIFDISALGLQSTPKSVSLAVISRTATVMTFIAEFTASDIKFYISRPDSIANVTVNISALIVY